MNDTVTGDREGVFTHRMAEPAEVWCSECRRTATRIVAGAGYCGQHATIAEHVVANAIERIKAQATRRFEGSTWILRAAALFALDPSSVTYRGVRETVPGGPEPTSAGRPAL